MEKPFIIGREKELQELLSDLEESKTTIRILHGESGVGKSRVFDALYYILKQDNNYKNTHFIGYYDKSKAVIVEATSYLYPFEGCLLDLIKSIKETQSPEERTSNFLKRLKRVLLSLQNKREKKLQLL